MLHSDVIWAATTLEQSWDRTVPCPTADGTQTSPNLSAKAQFLGLSLDREMVMGVHFHPANDGTSSLAQLPPIIHSTDDPNKVMPKNNLLHYSILQAPLILTQLATSIMVCPSLGMASNSSPQQKMQMHASLPHGHDDSP